MEIKDASSDEEYIPCLFHFMAGFDDFHVFYMFKSYPPFGPEILLN